MPHPGAPALLLRVGDHEQLTGLLRSGSVRSGLAKPARIVLLASEGVRNAEIAGRLSALLCELTNGRMSKMNYDLRTMVTEIDATYDDAQQEDRAERDGLAETLSTVREELARFVSMAAKNDDVRFGADAVIKAISAILDPDPAPKGSGVETIVVPAEQLARIDAAPEGNDRWADVVTKNDVEDAWKHLDAIADTGTSHTLHPRQYVVRCAWCPAIFFSSTKADAMEQFRAHEQERLKAGSAALADPAPDESEG